MSRTPNEVFSAFPEMAELVQMQKVEDLVDYLATNAKT